MSYIDIYLVVLKFFSGVDYLGQYLFKEYKKGIRKYFLIPIIEHIMEYVNYSN